MKPGHRIGETVATHSPQGRDDWRAARAACGSPCDGRCRKPFDSCRDRMLALLRRHGRHATSFQVLGPGFSYWFDAVGSDEKQDEGAVAYVDVAGYRVVAGPPVAPPGARARIAARFVAASLALRRRVVFFGVSEDFVDELRREPPSGGLDALPIGMQADFRASTYTIAGSRRRSFRAQVNRAHNHGVRVRRVELVDDAVQAGVRAAIENVLSRWLASRKMSVMGFVVDVHPFVCERERRYYLAERDGQPVGFLAAVPVYARQGWFLEDVIRVPDAPNGTNEALIHAALADVRREGADYATLGLAPLAGLPRGPGRHRLLRAGLRRAYRSLGFLYGFRSLFAFKRRIRPDGWAKQYLVSCPPPVGVAALRAVLTAFAGGGLLGFARDTLVRLAARASTRRLALLLVALAVVLIVMVCGGRLRCSRF